MNMTDPIVAAALRPEPWEIHLVEASLAVGVVLAALAWRRLAAGSGPERD